MSLWHDLVRAYAAHPIEAPGLKVATLAQWALESGFGTSGLAQDHLNFGGLKFRARVNQGRENDPLAIPVDYVAHDGLDTYCKFASLERFLDGYWAFIDNGGIYDGWRAFADDPSGYIGHLRRSGYAEDPDYTGKVTALLPRIRREIRDLGLAAAFEGAAEAPPRRKLAVLIGHNEVQQGAVSPHLDVSEWRFNQRVFAQMAEKAEEFGLELRQFFRVFRGSFGQEIAQAYAEIDAWAPEAILELHFNSADSTSARGCEMLYWPTSTKGRLLADAVREAVIAELGLSDRGSKARGTGRGSTSLRASVHPTILTEPFFGSNAGDCAVILEQGEEALARAYLIGARDALGRFPAPLGAPAPAPADEPALV